MIWKLSSSLFLASLVAAQSQKLNLPLPLNPASAGGDVLGFRLSPDDAWVVYSAREAADARVELRSLPLDRATPATRLTDVVSAAESLLQGFTLSPDSEQVFFRTVEYVEQKDDEDQLFELALYRVYVAPLDGSRAAKLLVEVASVFEPTLYPSPDGSWLVYDVSDDVSDGEDLALYSVPADGHRDPIELVTFDEHWNPALHLTTSRLLYTRFSASLLEIELWAVDLTGTNRQSLSGPMAPRGRVEHIEVSPDGAYALYRADQATNDFFELFSVPVGGGSAPRRVNGALVAGGDVTDFALSPDSTRVVYRADQERDRIQELFVAPIDASSAAVKVSGAASTAGSVSPGARFSADSSRVVFPGDLLARDVFQLFSAPADASAAPVLISGPFVAGGDVLSFVLTAGDTAVYLADAEGDEAFELYRAALDGSAPPAELSGSLIPAGDVVEFTASTGGTHVYFRADAATDGAFDLFSVPVSGALAPARINLLSRPPGSPFTFAATSDGQQVFYQGTEMTPAVRELYQRPADASLPPRTVNGTLSPGDVQGDVSLFLEDPVRGRVLYTGDQFLDGFDALTSVATLGAREHVQLNDPVERSSSSISSLRVSQGRVVYVQPSLFSWGLFSVPTDRSAAPVSLSQDLAVRPHDERGLLLTPGGERVVFRTWGDIGPLALYVAPIDGSAPALELSGALAGNNQDGLAISPDGARIVYRADADQAGILELFSVLLDGGAAPLKVSGTLVPGGDVAPEPRHGLPITPDGRFVVYRADALADERVELFLAPLDASAPPLRISGPLIADGDVQSGIGLDPTGRRVVYRADARADELFELFSVALDGSSPPARLSLDVSRDGGFAIDYGFSPDGAQVVHRADADGDGLIELYATPVAGGRVARLDSGAASVVDFLVDPTGARVVYRATPSGSTATGIFSVPLDASLPPVRLDPGQGSVSYYQITPDGKRVVYRASRAQADVVELFCVPLDGHRPATLLHEPLLPGRGVTTFRISADGRRVFYRADQEADDVFELFQTSLGWTRRSP